MKDVLAVISGEGQGTRLYPLTKYRAKPAVPIGGKFRLIDIPISNCLHSNIRKIYVLTLISEKISIISKTSMSIISPSFQEISCTG
jgi:ADP-glucose pyrophosphorylase